jgi:hypothetical protein
MRAALLLCCCLIACEVYAEARAPSYDEIASQSTRARVNTLASIRNAADGDAVLLALGTEAALRAEARREAGDPPLFPGCLRPDEFELSAQLALARASLDGKTYRVLATEFNRLATTLRVALDHARSSGDWNRHFAHLGHWIEDWSQASEAVTRELLRRTLVDQAIRASLSSFDGAKIYGKSRAGAALRSYDEYVFNLMCANDEDNLRWLKAQLEVRGWFDARKYGAGADHAAWLLVQHADGDPEYQAYMVRVLEPKLATRDTSAENFANLSDRVAVRAGRPQKYGTQMECVDGVWLAPNVEDPEWLDARRAQMGLPPYLEQLARGKLLCRKRGQ